MAAVSKLIFKLLNTGLLKSASATSASLRVFSSENYQDTLYPCSASGGDAYTDIIRKNENTWEAKLSSKQYAVCRLKSTEQPFSSNYWNMKEKGIYACICCGNHLFQSKSKFDCGSGYPSFSAAFDHCGVIKPCPVKFADDWSTGDLQKEVLCAKCGAHLGHVFRDGPKPTGLRYTVNGTALKFIPCTKHKGCETEVNYWAIGPQPETSAIKTIKHN